MPILGIAGGTAVGGPVVSDGKFVAHSWASGFPYDVRTMAEQQLVGKKVCVTNARFEWGKRKEPGSQKFRVKRVLPTFGLTADKNAVVCLVGHALMDNGHEMPYPSFIFIHRDTEISIT